MSPMVSAARVQFPTSESGTMDPPGPTRSTASSAAQKFVLQPWSVRVIFEIFPGNPETGMVEGAGVVVLKFMGAGLSNLNCGVMVMLQPPSRELPPVLNCVSA